MSSPTVEYLKRVSPGFLQELMLCPTEVFEPVFDEIKIRRAIDAIVIKDKKWYQKYIRVTFLLKHESINTFYLANDLLVNLKIYFPNYFIDNRCY